MKKTVAKKQTKHAAKKIKARHQVGKHVYWYGIHIQHIGLGVALVGSITFLLLVSQNV